MLENTEGAIKNGQSRETDNIWYTRRRKKKTKTQYVLGITIRKQTQITELRHLPSYKQLEVKTNRTSFFAEIVTDITTWNSERKDNLAVLVLIISQCSQGWFIKSHYRE
jgi:hypothetical protein